MLTRRAVPGYGAAALVFASGARAQSPSNYPAIAALQNRRAEAKPITVSERAGRCAQARRFMAEQKLDAICLAGGSSL
jgi:Xaa-Pro dipeptidase